MLFVGINPSLRSAEVGHHFARPGNRFWPTLHLSGFTDRLLSPFEEQELLGLGVGITNIVARATATAAQLSRLELREGGERLREKVERFAPRVLAVLGVTAYRDAFEEPDASVGAQPATIGVTRVWVLPNPSGLNAHYQLPQLADAFRALREAVDDE